MKKISKQIVSALTLIVLVLIMLSKSFALASTAITLEPSATSVPLNGEFTVIVKATNTRDTIGVTSIEGTLNFDEKFLVPLIATNIEGLNGWTTQYDVNTKTLKASTTQGTVKNQTEIFKITFKTKSTITNTPTTTATTTTQPVGTVNNANTTNVSTTTPVTGTTAINTGVSTTTNTATPITNVSSTTPVNTNVNTTNQTGVVNNVATTTPVNTNTAVASTATNNTTTNSTATATSGDAKIELANIRVSNGAQTQPITARAITVKVGATTAPVATPTVTPALNTSPVANPKAGVEDTPVILLIALSLVAVVAFVRYKKVTKY